MTSCEQYGHLYDTLYPKSVYYCPQCETQHGTSAVNGAVSWHCPKCWIEGRKSVDQIYIGRTCTRCGELDSSRARIPADHIALSNGKSVWKDPNGRA
jgi:hypothetical protein